MVRVCLRLGTLLGKHAVQRDSGSFLPCDVSGTAWTARSVAPSARGA